jgi:hypothetical protein
MPARYTSFVIRHWQLTSGARRIVVEHVQSGAQSAVATLADATTWPAAQVGSEESPADERPPEDPDQHEDGGVC